MDWQWAQHERADVIAQLATLAEAIPAVLDEIVGPPLPPHTEDAWRAFLTLSAERPMHHGGVGRITGSAILAYCDVEQTTLTALDIACIRAADAVVMRHVTERMREASAAPRAPDTKDLTGSTTD